HARVTFEDRRWWIRDLDTAEGIRQDGVPRREFILTPGVEVGIGETTFVAESPRSVALRSFCCRLLGWGADRLQAVDLALRALRLAAAHRSALVIRGDGDLVPIAHALHRRTLGDPAPFIVCDRRRRDTDASVRAPANLDSGCEALASASGGSMCVHNA